MMNSKQANRTIDYIYDFGSITRAEAFTELGIANLPAVINILRKNGYNIKTLSVPHINRWGEKCHYARYELEQE